MSSGQPRAGQGRRDQRRPAHRGGEHDLAHALHRLSPCDRARLDNLHRCDGPAFIVPDACGCALAKALHCTPTGTSREHGLSLGLPLLLARETLVSRSSDPHASWVPTSECCE
jgi:hypothetical protein